MEGTTMELARFSDVPTFVARSSPFLLTHEAHNNLLLGLCAELARNPYPFAPAPSVMLTVARGATLVLAALQTSPNNLILSHTEHHEALDLLASTLAAEGHRLPGVQGARADAAHFARHWAALHGQQITPAMNLRIYQLTTVRPPAPALGQMRRATEADRQLLEAWFAAFHAEATPGGIASDKAAVVTRWLTSPSRYLALWEDGEPVALAGATGPTPNGIRIGAVYTPPERRRRGYASALVAALSQYQLDTGRRCCFLFTDLRNPTSNHIYQALGYEPVVDIAELRFVP
jgi:predicted GNAT family acetyltransferase